MSGGLLRSLQLELRGACVREVRLHYSPVEIGDFQQVLAHIPRLPPYFAQHAGAIAVDCQDGITAGTNNNVEHLTQFGASTGTQTVKVRIQIVCNVFFNHFRVVVP